MIYDENAPSNHFDNLKQVNISVRWLSFQCTIIRLKSDSNEKIR